MNDGLWICVIILLVIAVVACVPLVSIWALNTLFGLTIPYTLSTWAASLWLTGLLQKPFQNKKD